MEEASKYLRENERLDDLELDGLMIIQNPDMFCFGIDAVLLSSFAEVREGDRVVDFGSGNGILPLLLSAKTGASHITGLEIGKYNVDMARRSVSYNNLEDKIEIINGDIKDASSILGASLYNVIVSNPPYMKEGSGIINETDEKTIARHEVLCDLDDIMREASALLKESGRMYVVHRPNRLTEIFEAMKSYRLEPKRMRLVHPYADKEPNLVLIEAIKGAKPYLRIAPPLVVYKDKGEYTDEILQIYGKF